MSNIDDDNGWNQWSKHVLRELERLNDNIESARNEIATIKSEITKLQSEQNSVNDIKVWKAAMENVATPTQLKEMKDEIEKLRTFRTISTTVWAVVQLLMTLLIAFKDKIF